MLRRWRINQLTAWHFAEVNELRVRTLRIARRQVAVLVALV